MGAGRGQGKRLKVPDQGLHLFPSHFKIGPDSRMAGKGNEDRVKGFLLLSFPFAKPPLLKNLSNQLLGVFLIHERGNGTDGKNLLSHWIDFKSYLAEVLKVIGQQQGLLRGTLHEKRGKESADREGLRFMGLFQFFKEDAAHGLHADQ